MPIQGILASRDATAYYNLTTDFDPADPEGWLDDANTVEATNIMDLTEDVGSDMADTTTRAEAKEGWSGEIAVLKVGRISFDIRWEPSDTFTAGLIAAWDGQSGISMAFLDRPWINDATLNPTGEVLGIGAIWSVSMNIAQNLRDIQKGSPTVTVAKNPKWIEATKGP